MPAWLAAIWAQMPALIADINAIFNASNGNPTPAQMKQVAAYSATLHGINQALSYHTNA